MTKLKAVLSCSLLVLAALLLMLPYLPPAAANLLLVIGYASLPIILANVLAAVLRKGRWRWAHLAATVLSIPLLLNYIPIIPRQAKAGTTSLKVVSWNVDNFLVSPDTMLRSAQYLRSLKPDIICLQERPHEVKVSWSDTRSAFPQYHAVRNSSENEVLNLAILSRHRIVGTGERTFADTYNKYMWADVAIGTDTLRVFSVHLQTTGTSPVVTGSAAKPKTADAGHLLTLVTHNAALRNEQASLLCRDIEASRHPVVVCGDFNDTPSGYPARRLRRLLTDASRRWPLCGTFQGMGGIMKIDYMMCGSRLKPLSYQLADTPWSDHLMQVGEVSLEGK